MRRGMLRRRVWTAGLGLALAIMFSNARVTRAQMPAKNPAKTPADDAQHKAALAAIKSWREGSDVEVKLSGPEPTFDKDLLARGKKTYNDRCAFCHGEQGDGNGKDAHGLSPQPRDFTKGLYEFRSTPSGALPTDLDIFTVVTKGLHGTGMVPWIALSERDRWAVVAYVEQFSPRFAHEPRPAAIEVPKAPEVTPAMVAEGHKLFVASGCPECHGPGGHADGPKAASLVDSDGRQINLLDFARGVFRRGSNLEDFFLTIRTGLNGTPMPGYEKSLSVDQTWAVAAYVQSLIATPGGTPEGRALAEKARDQETVGVKLDFPGMAEPGK